jgi:hypothetical protein
MIIEKNLKNLKLGNQNSNNKNNLENHFLSLSAPSWDSAKIRPAGHYFKIKGEIK